MTKFQSFLLSENVVILSSYQRIFSLNIVENSRLTVILLSHFLSGLCSFWWEVSSQLNYRSLVYNLSFSESFVSPLHLAFDSMTIMCLTMFFSVLILLRDFWYYKLVLFIKFGKKWPLFLKTVFCLILSPLFLGLQLHVC